MIRSRRLAVLSLAAAAVLGACKDSTGPKKSTDNTVGTASFQYTGFTSGSFSASGAPPTSSVGQPQFAAAQRTDVGGEGIILLFGVQPTSNGRSSVLQLEMAEPSGPAALSLADTCGTSTSVAGCAFALVGFNIDVTTTDSVPGEQIFATDAGTVQITQISTTRVKGTFTAHATDDNGHTITITGGAFDVPIVSTDNPSFGRQAAGPSLSRLAPPRAARFAPCP